MLDIIKEFINSFDWPFTSCIFISQLVNVILSTIKSVLTVKGTRMSATLINTISYTINAAVISKSETLTTFILFVYLQQLQILLVSGLAFMAIRKI